MAGAGGVRDVWGGYCELHRVARLCTMLDSGGKSRVKRNTITALWQRLSCIYHSAYSRALAVGNHGNGDFYGIFPITSSFSTKGGFERFWGK